MYNDSKLRTGDTMLDNELENILNKELNVNHIKIIDIFMES